MSFGKWLVSTPMSIEPPEPGANILSGCYSAASLSGACDQRTIFFMIAIDDELINLHSPPGFLAGGYD